MPSHKKSEADLQSEFVKAATVYLPDYVVIQHRNPSDAGTPDISITGGKLGTSWIEFKLARPSVRARGVQDIMVARLDARGTARYVIFRDVDGVQTTHICKSKRVQDGTWTEFGVPGWGMKFICDYVRSLHEDVDSQ